MATRKPSLLPREFLVGEDEILWSHPAEEWRQVAGHPFYGISSFGRVYSARNRRLLKVKTSPENGYTYVSMGRFTNHRVAPLLLETFTGAKPTSAHQAAHLDGIRWNDRVSNLEWKTPKENALDKLVHGTEHEGAGCWNAKLDDDMVRRMRVLRADGWSLSQMEKEFPVKAPTISRICLGKAWKHVA